MQLIQGRLDTFLGSIQRRIEQDVSNTHYMMREKERVVRSSKHCESIRMNIFENNWAGDGTTQVHISKAGELVCAKDNIAGRDVVQVSEQMSDKTAQEFCRPCTGELSGRDIMLFLVFIVALHHFY